MEQGSLTARSPAEAMSRQKCGFDGWEIACEFASEECQIAMAFFEGGSVLASRQVFTNVSAPAGIRYPRNVT